MTQQCKETSTATHNTVVEFSMMGIVRGAGQEGICPSGSADGTLERMGVSIGPQRWKGIDS